MERPATGAGRWAGWLALVAFATLFTSAIVNMAFESVSDVVRLTVVAIFALSGLGALALSVRRLMMRERSIVVWAAFVVGLFATALMIGELTFLE